MRALRFTLSVLRASLSRFVEDDGVAMAGHIAFSSLLAVFPFLVFATALAGLVLGADHGRETIDALFRLAPEHVAQTLEPVLLEVLDGRGNDYITVSILAAIWLASSAVESYRIAFDRAYGGVGRRGFLARRLRAIVFVLLGAVVAATLGVAVIFAPALMHLGYRLTGFTLSGAAVAASFLAAVLVFALYLLLMHRLLPSHPMKGVRLWPGVGVSVGMWIGGALGFSYYLSMVPNYSLTYGALAGVIITLVFFYLSGLSVLFGAEVNAELHARRRNPA